MRRALNVDCLGLALAGMAKQAEIGNLKKPIFNELRQCMAGLTYLGQHVFVQQDVGALDVPVNKRLRPGMEEVQRLRHAAEDPHPAGCSQGVTGTPAGGGNLCLLHCQRPSSHLSFASRVPFSKKGLTRQGLFPCSLQ